MDHQVQRLISARGKSAVNKLELIEFRRRHPQVPIIIFEGADDVIVYNVWIFRIDNRLRYEPFPVNGKDQVLGLKHSLDSDLNNISDMIFYIVDRDFDDLKDASPDDTIFMTDRYSVENYLTEPSVVEQVLSSELGCAKQPEIRQVLLDLYVRVYAEFLQLMKEVNLRIYTARKCQIKILPAVPEKIGRFLQISLERIENGAVPMNTFIAMAREPTDAELEKARLTFEGLNPALRHRGKFLLNFMMKWFECVNQEWHKPSSAVFSGVNRSSGNRYHEIVMGSLAARSPMPVGLNEFLNCLTEAEAAPTPE